MAVTLSISRIHPKRSSATLSDLGGQIFAFYRIDLTRGPPTIQLNHALLRWRDQFAWIVSGCVAPPNGSQTGSVASFSGVVTSDQTANRHTSTMTDTHGRSMVDTEHASALIDAPMMALIFRFAAVLWPALGKGRS
jgi:hypothetical protein